VAFSFGGAAMLGKAASVCFLGALIFAPAQSNAITLAGNLSMSGSTAASAWQGTIGAEDFALAQSSTVNQLGFIAW
jgi:hypothetical protein